MCTWLNARYKWGKHISVNCNTYYLILETSGQVYSSLKKGSYLQKTTSTNLNYSKKHRQEEEESSQRRQKHDSCQATWYNGTEYQCQLCSCLFYDSGYLILHINDRHNKSVEEYKHEVGYLITKQASYQCQVCDQYINHQLEDIER